jgi:hypothetical protein
LALSSTDVSTVDQVQYRRWNRGRWVGPAAGFAAGAIIGGALSQSAYNDGYYAYGAAPRGNGYYAYGAANNSGYYNTTRNNNYAGFSPQWGSCTGDRDDDSAFPSWACR